MTRTSSKFNSTAKGLSDSEIQDLKKHGYCTFLKKALPIMIKHWRIEKDERQSNGFKVSVYSTHN